MDTEKSFGRDMSVVEDIYRGTSSSCPDLGPDDIKLLFGNTAQIVKFSNDFLDALKKAAKSVYMVPMSQRFHSQRSSRAASTGTAATTTTTTPTLDEQVKDDQDEPTDVNKDRETFIGQAFNSHLGELETAYTIYLSNHDVANRRLRTLQQKPKVDVWLKECRQWAADLTNAWDLDSLLVKPVQRLLKYPLLLTQLLDATAEDHPDRPAIKQALHQLTELSVRINEKKKHSELVEQGLRKRHRKESDVRMGITKAIGRRTEKLKQNVGVSRVVEDREYAQIRERYAENVARLVMVREDVKNYMNIARLSTNGVSELGSCIDRWIDVAPTNFPDKESRWRQYAMTVRELMTVAVPEHMKAIQKAVVDPMTAGARMLEALLKDSKGLVQRRDMKSMDYARYKNARDRGERLDKKSTDRMEEWEALNREAKGRMYQLIRLTGRLAQGCLQSFVQLQSSWLLVWQRKLEPLLGGASSDVSTIAREWQADWDFHEAHALALGICNGSLLAEAVNLLGLTTPSSTLDGGSSPRQPSWSGDAEKRSCSIQSDVSPRPIQDFSRQASGSFTGRPSTATTMAEHNEDGSSDTGPADGLRAGSAGSGPGATDEAARRLESRTGYSLAPSTHGGGGSSSSSSNNNNTHSGQGVSTTGSVTSAGEDGALRESTDRTDSRARGSAGPAVRTSSSSSSDPMSANPGTVDTDISPSRPDIESFYSAYSAVGPGPLSSGRHSPPRLPSQRRSTTTAVSPPGHQNGNNSIVVSPHMLDSSVFASAPSPSTIARKPSSTIRHDVGGSNTVPTATAPSIPTRTTSSSFSAPPSDAMTTTTTTATTTTTPLISPSAAPTTSDTLFLAASVYEFNIDRSRREAGFPYLTYVSGEIFDVIAERGELWLARNQDDAERVVGWIWNKHFAKVGAA